MTNTIAINSLESVTINGKSVGSITNAIANKNATPQELHDALVAYHKAQVASATATATAAAAASGRTALNALQTQLDNLVQQGLAAGSDPVKLKAVVAQASVLSSPARLAAKQKRLAEVQAEAAKIQAELAAL